MEYLVNLFFTF